MAIAMEALTNNVVTNCISAFVIRFVTTKSLQKTVDIVYQFTAYNYNQHMYIYIRMCTGYQLNLHVWTVHADSVVCIMYDQKTSENLPLTHK